MAIPNRLLGPGIMHVEAIASEDPPESLLATACDIRWQPLHHSQTHPQWTP